MMLRFLLTVLVILALPFFGLLWWLFSGLEKAYAYRQKHHVAK
jgi:hypothetical protein